MSEDTSNQPESTRSAGPATADCVIVGAGAAGISAAQWLRSLDVRFRWFEAQTDAGACEVSPRLGGMLWRVHNTIKNYPGATYANGPDVLRAFLKGLDDCDGLRPEVAEITRIFQNEDAIWTVEFSTRPPLQTRTVILATGTRYRRLGVPGEMEGVGRYISQSASVDGERFAGQKVAVVGGGDAAYENAIILAPHVESVTLLVRDSKVRARQAFQERVKEHANIHVYPHPAEVTRIEATAAGCRLHLDTTGPDHTMDVAGVFIRIGVEAVRPEVGVATERGFIAVDTTQATSLDGIFAAGDITNRPLRSIATAVGDAAAAARGVATWLEAHRQ